jgi:hypothetical protein
MLISYGSQSFVVRDPPRTWRSFNHTMPRCLACGVDVTFEWRVDGLSRLGCNCTVRGLSQVKINDSPWKVRK